MILHIEVLFEILHNLRFHLIIHIDSLVSWLTLPRSIVVSLLDLLITLTLQIVLLSLEVEVGVLDCIDLCYASFCVHDGAL